MICCVHVLPLLLDNAQRHTAPPGVAGSVCSLLAASVPGAGSCCRCGTSWASAAAAVPALLLLPLLRGNSPTSRPTRRPAQTNTATIHAATIFLRLRAPCLPVYEEWHGFEQAGSQVQHCSTELQTAVKQMHVPQRGLILDNAT
jgi:hypothetical protein